MTFASLAFGTARNLGNVLIGNEPNFFENHNLSQTLIDELPLMEPITHASMILGLISEGQTSEDFEGNINVMRHFQAA